MRLQTPADNSQAAVGATAAAVCDHCGLPVPAGLIEESAPLQFCCAGCKAVYHVIHGCGLARFYQLRDSAGAAAQPGRTTPRKYGEFDDAAFMALYCRPLADGTQSAEFYLEGVHCAACVWLVEKLPQVLPGVLETRLDIRRALVQVRWDAARVKLSQIARQLDLLGYPPHPAKDARSRQFRRQENRRFLIRVGVAAACAGNIMMLAFALYGGEFSGIERQYSQLFRWTSMIFGLIALAWPGSLFFRGAWAAWRTRTAHLDVPIAVALTAGGLAGMVNALLGRGEIYFDSLAMLVLLLLLGRWLQRRQQCWANDAVELLFSLTPASARRVEGGQVADVSIEALLPGDLIEIRAGDCVPADGTVQEGRSTVDQALLTGESQPAAVAPGDKVHAGTLNLANRLLVRVEAVGIQTRVGRLLRLVEESSSKRAPIVLAADRLAGLFVRVVLAMALVTLGLWLWRAPAQAIDHAVALLIVSCPCGLGLATPLAVTIALGRAARRHIFIKGGEALELLSRRGTILLDKTGTLTAGRISLVRWHGDPALQPLVAALEQHSAHPIAQTLVAGLQQTAPPPTGEPIAVTEVRQTLGGGIAGSVAGRRLVVGSPQFVRSCGVVVEGQMKDAEEQLLAAAMTPVLVGIDGVCAAVAGLEDPLRSDVPQALLELKKLGWKAKILSGDHPRVVAAVASKLGLDTLDALGGVDPEGKVACVRQAAQNGPVVMVGDGVNDAAALAAAGVGIAVHGGAEASLAAAQVYLDRPGLAPIVELMHASRRTLWAIRRCLAASVCYNGVAGALAMAGWISPLAAAILMPISSFTVLALAYATRTFGEGTVPIFVAGGHKNGTVPLGPQELKQSFGEQR